jgi:hypothetical protein
MADNSINASQVRALAEQLGRVPGRAMDELDPIVKAAAEAVKRGMVADARGSRHFRGLAGSISYDRKQSAMRSVGYEVGPDKGRRGGALGNIYYFGTSRGGGSGDLEGPLNAAAPAFRAALAQAAAQWVGQGVSGGSSR